VGTPTCLTRASRSDSSEDFINPHPGTVSTYYALGLVSAAVSHQYGSLTASQLEYEPLGMPTGLCVGIATAPFQGEALILQPCTVPGRTVFCHRHRGFACNRCRAFVPDRQWRDDGLLSPVHDELSAPRGHQRDAPPDPSTSPAVPRRRPHRARHTALGRGDGAAAVGVPPPHEQAARWRRATRAPPSLCLALHSQRGQPARAVPRLDAPEPRPRGALAVCALKQRARRRGARAVAAPHCRPSAPPAACRRAPPHRPPEVQLETADHRARQVRKTRPGRLTSDSRARRTSPTNKLRSRPIDRWGPA
jgi:hypothetical protein